MIGDLVKLHNDNAENIQKAQAIIDNRTAEITTLIRERKNLESRYSAAQKERAEATGQKHAYTACNREIMRILDKFDREVIEKMGLIS